MLSKIHSYRLLFRRFCLLGNILWFNAHNDVVYKRCAFYYICRFM